MALIGKYFFTRGKYKTKNTQDVKRKITPDNWLQFIRN